MVSEIYAERSCVPQPLPPRERKLVYLVYLDDAGQTGIDLSNTEQPYHVMAVVPIRENTWCDLEATLESLVVRRIPKASERRSFEFHAQDLFQGNGGIYKANRAYWTAEKRFALLREFLQVIVDCKLPIIYGAVNKKYLKEKYSDPYNPRDLTFLLCAERVEQWFCKYANDEKGMFIADETTAAGKLAMKKSLKFYRKFNVPLGVKNERLNHVVETVHFVDSKESFGVQIADACSYFIKRFLCRKENSVEFYRMIAGNLFDYKIFP